MKKLIYFVFFLVSIAMIAGCASTSLSVPGANKVMISQRKAPKSCKYLGMITANQGNFFTGSWTSNKNLQEGAFNDMRNQAAKLGGNRVVLLMSHAASTLSGGGGGAGGIFGAGLSGRETNVALTGNVYKCPHQ